MKLQRITLFAGWLIVSLLAVAGFAAFSAGEDPAGLETGTAVAAGVGRSAGAVSGLAFAYQNEPLPTPSVSVDADAALQQALETRRTLTADSDAEPSTTANGTYIRSRYLSESEVRELVSRYFRPADVNRAVRVAWCESSFNPNSINPTSGASGLFQHLPQYWADRSAAAGFAGADIFDPEANVAVAAWLLYEFPGGWSHWTCNA